MSKETRTFDLEDRLIDYTIRIIRTAESLPKTKVGNHIAGQLIRCGTSPAPNYGEAQSAESRSDFIHKMKVCLKELRETRVWLLQKNFIIRHSLFDIRYSMQLQIEFFSYLSAYGVYPRPRADIKSAPTFLIFVTMQADLLIRNYL